MKPAACSSAHLLQRFTSRRRSGRQDASSRPRACDELLVLRARHAVATRSMASTCRSKYGHACPDGTGNPAVDDQVGAGDETGSRTE
jgi:hypothetical protein